MSGSGSRAQAPVRAQAELDKHLKQMDQEGALEMPPIKSDAKWLSKIGQSGQHFLAVTNNFYLKKTPDFPVIHYRVDTYPKEDSTVQKKLMIHSQQEILGTHLFDGENMFTLKELETDPMELETIDRFTGKRIKIFIRKVRQVEPSSMIYLQIFNILLKKAFSLMGLEQCGRDFVDPNNVIIMKDEGLEIWSGIPTAIRDYEVGLLARVEPKHKILRSETILDLITRIKARSEDEDDFERNCKKEFIGGIVITHYNGRTYMIDDVDVQATPLDNFVQQDGVKTSYLEYYRSRYNITCIPEAQPMLVSFPKKKDVNKGVIENLIYLVPSLCHPTGLSEEMRRNVKLMRQLNEHLTMGPDKRKVKLDQFMQKIQTTPGVQEEFKKWDLEFDPDNIACQARQFPAERIYIGPAGYQASKDGEWSRSLKGRGMISTKELTNWLMFLPERKCVDIEQLLKTMKMAASSIKMNLIEPLTIVEYKPSRMIARIKDELNRLGEDVKFVFVVLATNNVHRYADVKRLCIMEFAVGCQCFLAKNIYSPKARQDLPAICSRIMIQINSKLGGVPWAVKIPLKGLMVVGLDSYKCSEKNNRFACALVASSNESLTKYYSSVHFVQDASLMYSELISGMRDALKAYMEDNNGQLPTNILVFRPSEGDGQIKTNVEKEAKNLRLGISLHYQTVGVKLADLSVIIVSKNINARVLMEAEGSPQCFDNVPSGTVVDNCFTFPNRYDFYMISQCVNDGTANPTYYNVVYDETGLSADKMQRMCFKLCHLDYNSPSSVKLPAVLGYAHKLAYLTGIALNDKAPKSFAKLLWYL